MQSCDVAIVGAGFSGAMVAVHLARISKGRLRISLCERGGPAGRGIAYGTPDRQHLLNVRAVHMGAFPDAIGDFHDWLQAHPQVVEQAGIRDMGPDSFVPRMIYGAYLEDILQRTRAEFPGLEILRVEITDVVPAGAEYTLWSGDAPHLQAKAVVLALGNFPPGSTGAGAVNPYDPAMHAKLAEPGDVFLVGTGLTSLDLLVTMARTKAEGIIHMLSRGGMFPQVHDAVQRYPRYVDENDLPTTVLALLKIIRHEVRKAAGEGIGWRSVLDALRPLNPRMWQALPFAEQRKFLKRLRPYWDTHRHRCAAEVMAARDRFAAEGRLIRHRGSFLSMKDTGDGVAVTWQPDAGPETETGVHCAVVCTGPQSDCRKLDDPLVRNLLRRDLMAPDRLRMGADTMPDASLKNSRGEIVPGLYTMGTWRKGALYESVAVPELRCQARDLADVIVQRLCLETGSNRQ